MTTLDLYHDRLAIWLLNLEAVLMRHPNQALRERLSTLRATLALVYAAALGWQRRRDAEALSLDFGPIVWALTLEVDRHVDRDTRVDALEFLFTLQRLFSDIECACDGFDSRFAARRGGVVDGWIDLLCGHEGAVDFVLHARRALKRWLVADMVNNRRCDRLMAFVLQFTDPAELQAMVAELQKSIAQVAAVKGVARA